jgi:type I restriction enzyme R subunit
MRLETVRALCEPVDPPRDVTDYQRYFVAKDSGDAAQMKANEPKRLALYTHVAALIRAFAAVAGDLSATGCSDAELAKIKGEVDHYERARTVVKIASLDQIDLKQYEPAMRQLIDRYIRAEESEVLSAFDDTSLLDLVVEKGAAAMDALPRGLCDHPGAAAETIENNMRRLIVDEYPINPKYYEKMSELLSALMARRKEGAIEYKEYLVEMVELARKAKNPGLGGGYPPSLDTPGRRALYDNLGGDEALALKVHKAVIDSRQDGWRTHPVKTGRVRRAIAAALGDESGAGPVLELVKNHSEF